MIVFFIFFHFFFFASQVVLAWDLYLGLDLHLIDKINVLKKEEGGGGGRAFPQTKTNRWIGALLPNTIRKRK